MFSRRTYENHGREARQGRALQKRLPHELMSKRRFGKSRLEAAHWVKGTSFEPQGVLCQFPVPQILVTRLYT